VASENAGNRTSDGGGSASENTEAAGSEARRRGAPPTTLGRELAEVHERYVDQLRRAPLSAETRRTYGSKVRQYLAWLETADVDGEPLDDPAARDWAVRDYRSHLVGVLKRANATVNNALAAIDDLYIRRGLGPATADRLDLPQVAPRSLEPRAVTRWLRAVDRRPLARDRALVLTPFYAGARIAETVGLDLDDVALSARKGTLRFLGKGAKPRLVELHPQLRAVTQEWVDERASWPGADGPALYLNRRGGRLSVRAASDIYNAVVDDADLDDASAHILRHTFATTLIRNGTDIVIVSELLGHARLEQTRRYSLPTSDDRRAAISRLPVDR
jgi:site-specific recombinase XerD